MHQQNLGKLSHTSSSESDIKPILPDHGNLSSIHQIPLMNPSNQMTGLTDLSAYQNPFQLTVGGYQQPAVNCYLSSDMINLSATSYQNL